ncbi:GNAT family N-acetyltransferase [Hymenobacter sp. IS2118]|uniref:GNAT family N-acetyltransferase n=1 Tax=Hymenobacter sp. IS2118 TaxID=1505605 RepID=UPI00068A385D|nr:GNAT family N-acetyltransferase [Hymenobacter sp. IS2118]
MTAASPLQHLAWDSDFLGFPVARLAAGGLGASAIAAAVAEARQAGYRLLYAIVLPTDTAGGEALRQAGSGLADRKVTYAMALTAADAVSISPAISDATAYSMQLESLAWQSGEYSRFRLDRRFQPGVFQELYSQWLRNSLSGELARRVLVWRSAQDPEAGLLTLGEKNGRADIGLLAVDVAARGQRGGQQLVAAARAQAAAWGFATLQVVTQGDNVAACRFYEKCGFLPESEEHIYHLWLN